MNANASPGTVTIGGTSGTQTLNLSAGTFTINGSGTGNAQSALSISGGTLAGSGTLKLTGSLSWKGGEHQRRGAVQWGDDRGTSDKSLAAGRLINTGTLLSTNTSSNPLITGYGSVISNAPGATFILATDRGTSYSGSTYGTIYNAGLFQKTTGSGTATINDTFNNLAGGTVEVDSGTLSLQ